MKTDRTRVLLIEKSESEALAISSSLIKEGNGKYLVDTVASLAQAVISINQQHFDVVLAGMDMPGVEGFDIVPALLKHDENLPVVVLSDQENEQVTIDVMHSGAQDYLIKSRADGYLIRRALDYAIERKRIEQGISYLAQYDSLTGLANRALFRERLNRAMVRADRNKKIVALMFIDLDRFKNINDSMGHDVGDQLLVEIGNRLKECTREDDTIARQGGDEFTIILEDIAHIGDVSVVANKILNAMIEPVNVNGFELFVTPSIGITLYPIDDIHAKDLLRNADAAMYKAKDSGRNCFRFYTVDMNRHVEEKVLMETKLRHAIENQEFELHYQPKFNINSRELIGAEALIRWNHPEQGYISPGLYHLLRKPG